MKIVFALIVWPAVCSFLIANYVWTEAVRQTTANIVSRCPDGWTRAYWADARLYCGTDAVIYAKRLAWKAAR